MQIPSRRHSSRMIGPAGRISPVNMKSSVNIDSPNEGPRRRMSDVHAGALRPEVSEFTYLGINPIVEMLLRIATWGPCGC